MLDVAFALGSILRLAGTGREPLQSLNRLIERHSPPGGTVEVTVDPTGVRVRDHGSGVAEADLPHVFDRFYRGSNSRSVQGSGLGLAIVRQVAVQHGGSVSVANAPDGGAVFAMRLPGVAGADDGAGRGELNGAPDAVPETRDRVRR